MGLIEILIVVVGISLDVYAVVVCFGALLLRIDRHRLIRMCVIFCIWQVLALLGGWAIMKIPAVEKAAGKIANVWDLFGVIVFVALGLLMLYKAWKNKPVDERLTDIKYGQVVGAAFFTSIDALIAGFGLSFMNVNIYYSMLLQLIVTVIMVILGLYTGYRLGYEGKRAAYNIGGVLLLLTAVNIIFRYMAA